MLEDTWCICHLVVIYCLPLSKHGKTSRVKSRFLFMLRAKNPSSSLEIFGLFVFLQFFFVNIFSQFVFLIFFEVKCVVDRYKWHRPF